MRGESPSAIVHGRLVGWGGLLLSMALAGCGDRSPEGRAGLKIVPGDGWTKVANSVPVAPGTVVSAWSGPEGSSFVAFTSLPIPGPDAGALAKETAVRWLNLPGVSFKSESVETYSGLKAARVEATGPGTGDSFVPSGFGKPIPRDGQPLIETRRVFVSFPRAADTLTLLWHYPESARAAIAPRVESMLGSVEISDKAWSSYSY